MYVYVYVVKLPWFGTMFMDAWTFRSASTTFLASCRHFPPLAVGGRGAIGTASWRKDRVLVG